MQTSPSPYHFAQLGPLSELQRHSAGPVTGKAFVQALLGTTGCEVSLNRIEAGQGTPFLHAHKQNEEVFIVVSGRGLIHLDGVEHPLTEGDVVRVDPPVMRGLMALDQPLCYVCVQAKAGSLEQASRQDGIRSETKPRWVS